MFQEEHEHLQLEIEELEKQFNDPGIVKDPEKMRDLGKRYSEVKELLNDIGNWQKQIKELNAN